MDAILEAIDIHVDMSNKVPSPSDIKKIIEPEEILVTDAEYIEACKYQERNGYPMLSDAAETKRKYTEQRRASRDKFDKQRNKLTAMAASAFRKIDKGSPE